MKNFKLLLNFMKGSRLILVGAILAIVLSSVFSTLVPALLKIVIDSVIGTQPLNLPGWIENAITRAGGIGFFSKNLWICGLIIIGMNAGYGVFVYLKGRFAALVSENSAKQLRERIYRHILHLPYEYHVKSQAGDLIQRCTSDLETVQGFISNQFIEICQSIVSFSMVLGIMFSINTTYSLTAIVFVPVVLVATTIFFFKMKKTFRITDESEGRMTSTLQENLTGVRVVKAFGAQKFEITKFDDKNREYRDNVYKIVQLMAKFWSTMDLMTLLQFGLVLLMGIYWTNTGRITLGTMVAFSTYSGMLIWPVRQLGQIFAFMGQAFVSLNRIQEVLDAPEEVPGEEEKKPEIHGEIELEHVWFGYDEKHPILKDLSLKIKKGQTVAILGATGSGKSSLMHLLVRLYDYNKGSIRLDGVELREIERKWLRKNVGIVLQEPFLFSKSVRENIRFGSVGASDEEVHASSAIASIHESILSFEKGYDTMVGERGVTLSGGQRQRLAIARAVIRDVPILIFDDSLSAVDMETDAAIRRALNQRSKDTTTIIISHRITTLAEADVIFTLENGTIGQCGTHEELIGQEGLYKRVWELQSSMESELADIV